MVFVHQRPMFQEDEGRYHFLGNFGSHRQAELFIQERVKTSKGYYTESNFVISSDNLTG